MTIEPISVGDVKSIEKINLTIDQANLVPQKADQSTLESEIKAIPLPLSVNTRPGEATVYFTTSLTGGDPAALPSMSADQIRSGDAGLVVRMAGDDIAAARALYPLEPSKKYLVEFAVQRRVNSPDPDNDAIRCGLAWYEQARGYVGQVVAHDFIGVTTASGRLTFQAVVSRATADDVDIVPASNVRYCRPFVQTYGTLVQSDVEVIRWTDITNASAYSPDLTALEDRTTALESVDPGARLNVLESQVTSPNTFRVATMGDLVAATIPVTANTVELLGYVVAGDDGGHTRRRGVSGDPGAKQSADGAYWVVAADNPAINPELVGAAANGTTIDRDAMLASKSLLQLYGGTLKLVGGKAYNVGTTFTDLGGITIDPEPDATIVGNFNPNDNVTVTREMTVTINTGSGNPWTMVLSPRHKQPILEKAIWLSDASITRSTLAPINCLTDLEHNEIAFPDNDSITVNASGIAADVAGIALPAKAAGGFRMSLARIRACEEMTSYFDVSTSAGDYSRTGFFRCTNGFIVAWLSSFGTLNVGWKAVGEATGTKSGVDWVGRTQVPVYTGRACYMTLRLYDWQTVGVLISDKEVWRGKIGADLPASLGAVMRAGFGVSGSSDFVTIGNWTRRVGLTSVSGLQPVPTLILGDSLSEDWHMAYPRQLREAFYNTCGMRMDIVANYALGGQTSAQQLAKLKSSGIPAGVKLAVVTLSGNDEQSGVAIPTLRGTWNEFKSFLDAGGVRLHVILTNLPYTLTEAPGHGSNFANYLNHHLYRTAMMRWAADNGVTVTQSNQAIPPQVPSYIGTDDDVLRDNVHWGPMSMRTVAVQAAYDIAGLFAAPYKKSLDPIAFPSGSFMSGWGSGSSPLRMSINAEGWVRLSGSFTKASGVADGSMLQTFREFAPQYDVIGIVGSASGTGRFVRMGINGLASANSGQVYVAGTTSTDTTIWADGFTWKMAA